MRHALLILAGGVVGAHVLDRLQFWPRVLGWINRGSIGGGFEPPGPPASPVFAPQHYTTLSRAVVGRRGALFGGAQSPAYRLVSAGGDGKHQTNEEG